ncbi:MAG: (Fe-S)-binding protein [Fimbriimonadaceae bacterium]|nr:(Fe-S)-binding protein [Fimbriimonadaceae bacterium]
MNESLGDLTAACIKCGFCLESCPTFRLSGNEVESPRGRINLVRAAVEGEIEWKDTQHSLDTCLGCRACETACPSGVRYGAILESSRVELRRRSHNQAYDGLLNLMTSPSALQAQLIAARLLPTTRIPRFLSKFISNDPPEADLPRVSDAYPWPPVEAKSLPPVRGEVALLEGCVMRVLYPDVNEATVRLLRRVGLRVVPVDVGCCGALHAHAGDATTASEREEAMRQLLPIDMPLVVNSAGCGSHLLETRIASQVAEISTLLVANGLHQRLQTAPGLSNTTVTYHDACHLAHGQGVRSAPRELIAAIPGVTLVELSEPDTCCGSAGTYNLTQPRRARALLDRKWENIVATGASIVATGNPGCHAWISQAAREQGRQVRIMHTLDLLESAFSGLRPEAEF